MSLCAVVPAHAGTQCLSSHLPASRWVPASAGTTVDLAGAH